MEPNRALPSPIRFALLAVALLGLLVLPERSAAQNSTPALPDSARASVRPDSSRAMPKVAAGCADGEKDAASDHNSRAYGIAGLLTGPIGVGIAMSKTPAPRGARFESLSPESAPEYARCYGQRARKKNVRSAVNGFAIATFTALTVNFFIESKTAP